MKGRALLQTVIGTLLALAMAGSMPANAKPASGSDAAERRRQRPEKTRPPAARPNPMSRQLFIRMRCNDCHTVRSQRVAASARRKGRVTDLSITGRKRKAPWLRNYLRGRARVRGRAHPSRFQGSLSQLDRVVRWLAALR